MAAVLSMALGIGATAAVYSVLYGVLVDPYPYRDAARIAFVMAVDPQGHHDWVSLTEAEAQQLRRVHAVAGVLQDNLEVMTLTGGDLPETVNALEFSGNGFDFLGAPPMLGREFTAAQVPEGASPPPVAVLSYRFWKTHMSGDPGVVGRTLELNHAKYTILGVVGPRFTFRDGDVFLPMPVGLDRGTQFGTLVRLRAGVPAAETQGELDSAVRTLGHADRTLLPAGSFRIVVTSLNDELLGQFKGTLFLLFAAVELLLVIGCGNVAILMLARGAARQPELAMRTALGASRARLVRQLLTEAVLVAACGGALGCAFAYGAIRLITGLMPAYAIPHEVVIALNVPVLWFVTGVAMASGIVTGLWPALTLSRTGPAGMAQGAGTRTVAAGSSRVRSALLSGQIALTVLLLAGAGAAMRSFLAAHGADLGLDPRHLLMMNVAIPSNAYKTWEQRTRFYSTLAARMRTAPEVVDAAEYQGDVPPGRGWEPHVNVVGAPQDLSRTAVLSWASPGYFATMRISLLEGRAITEAEELRGARVAVVSEGFARRYLPQGDALGRQVAIPELEAAAPGTPAPPDADRPFVIVGVAADVRNNGMHDPTLPEIYVPTSTVATPGVGVLVRTTGEPGAALHAVERSIHRLERDAAVSRVTSYEDYLSEFAWAYDRFLSTLFSAFSAVALGLAAIGLFSTLAYAVEQRTRELGIRIALGASRGNVVRTVLGSTLATTGAGLAVGLVLSVGLSGVFYKWTQGSTANPGVLAGVSGVLAMAAVLAGVLPARRAMRIDPMEAVRSE